MNSRKKEDDLAREGQVTYDIYASMPDDGQRYGMIDGVLEAMSPGPSVSYRLIGGDLLYPLK